MSIETEKIAELMNDEVFLTKLSEAETPEAVQTIFAEKGVALTLDEITKIGSWFMGTEEEIDENMMETVSGGVAIRGPIWKAPDLWKILSKGKWPW